MPDDMLEPVKSQLLASGEMPELRITVSSELSTKHQTSHNFRPKIPPIRRKIADPTATDSVRETPQVILPYVYDSESQLFKHLVRESVSRKITAAQMQLLLGVTVRAEPLLAEVGLTYQGAANLPTRRDFLPWDSILASYGHIYKNWPGDADRFSEKTLGGTKTMPVRESRAVETVAGGTLCQPDPLALVTRTWDMPAYATQAEGLGPRLVRLRKLGGSHPSLGFGQALSDRRCANSAFCTKHVAPDTSGAAPAEGSVEWRCQKCDCTLYCSAICQATHRVAHEFECKGLRALRTAMNGFEEHGLDRTKFLLADTLEELLCKPLSMVSSADALVDKTALSTSLQHAIPGNVAQLQPTAAREGDGQGAKSFGFDKPATPNDQASRPQRGMTRDLEPRGTVKATKVPRKSLPTLDTRSQWKFGIGPEWPDAQDEKQEPPLALQPPVLGLFDVRLSHAHNAAGAARLLSRWASGTHCVPALKAALEDGLLFAFLTGAIQTLRFSSRNHQLRAAVTILCHRMSLHIAASKYWKNLGPLARIPEQLHATGLSSLDFAQYSAFYAFMKPRRLPFVQLQPFMPVLCIVWGKRLREALLALPNLSDPQPEEHGTSKVDKNNGVDSFWDVAAQYISDFQLVDTVHLDVLTGRTYFLLYTEVAKTQSHAQEAWVLMLDASRGMQVVATPIPARDLRRCAL